MEKTVTRNEWMVRTEWIKRSGNGWNESTKTYTFTRPTALRAGVESMLRTGGAALSYGIGWGIGSLLNNIAYLKDAIPNAVYAFSHVNIHDNINGALALVLGVYGLLKSGVKLDDHLRAKEYVVAPISVTLRK